MGGEWEPETNFPNMRTVILVRHAKSDWGNPGLEDFDRPLSERGKSDAPVMAQRLLDRQLKPDAIIASPAKRAAKTARYFAKACKISKGDIIYKEELYLAEPAVFFEVIEKAKDKFSCIALFSHNFGITQFANLLTDTRVDNIPTCGIFAVKADCKKWADFRDAPKTFLFFDYPKAGKPESD